MSDQEEIPDYLEKLQSEGQNNQDNFGPEDVYSSGEKGDLDSEVLLAKRGYDPHPPLTLLLSALIKGHNPELSDNELKKRLREVVASITNENKTGRGHVDDNDALLEIAWAYHSANYEINLKGEGAIKLRPIVRKIVDQKFSDVFKSRNIEKDNYIRKLEDKFNDDKDLYLSRATHDDDWGRTDKIQQLSKLVKQLGSLGIPVDIGEVKPRRLRKNVNQKGRNGTS